ncbi:hypothetical protein AJ79_02916 [Helicocarpus griseus UAMH5409]|uniref:Uncharacterized protein n=1 Tax=Helicocarpus griseus UAMH5409 TaxID=1447875 RepID=A0A2B7Y0M4_9EURO|nr:hypothetical protein AJ79_02916 [Helicocarpus griseus UAMH5409]
MSPSHRFDNFPFHKIESITVSLSAPDPEDPAHLFWLWRNSIRTTGLFKKALSVPPLTIQLQKFGNRDWHSPGRVERGMVYHNQTTLRLPEEEHVY